MENEGLNNMHDDLIATFTEITSSSKEAAQFFLESHNFDLDSAVSTFLETTINPNSSAVTTAAGAEVNRSPSLSPSPASSPSRSRSPSPTPQPRPQPTNPKPSSSRDGRIHTFSDLNRSSGNHHGDPDAPQEYYTGGEKSGMLVQGPPKANEADAFLDQIRQAGAVEGPQDHLQPSSSSRTFGGTARLLSGETVSPAVPLHPEVVTHTITFWHNGFTVNDGPLRRFDDPENASFIESIKRSECPEELEPADKRTKVNVQLMRKHEDCPAPQNRTMSFQGAGRTLGSSRSTPPMESTVAAIDLNSSPQPFRGLVVDQALPTTSIQLRLADGTRMVSRFNHYHTVRDIRGFIDASRVGGLRTYQLQTVGFPPELLTDLDQTIEQAGLANSVVIQKL